MGDSGNWHGFDREDFKLDGIDCILVRPREVAQGKPWLWRARFWGVEPQTEIALLNKGFHLAYIDVANLYGSPKAVARFDLLYAHLTQTVGLSKRPALMGFSRGGLIIYNWAAKNPQKVSCIYADAPVCDVKSWPAGQGASPGSPDDWQRCLQAYDMTQEQMLQWQGNPLDHVAVLTAAGVPVLHVCGDVDKTVPIAQNSDLFIKRYRELGGKAEYILKPGIGHHPHSLPDPAPIVEFILTHTVNG
jgi:pimeloyl-ACP methyl ester carboxylesterase